jgi:glycosyltransferase involved in cell wall biosynthesis
MSTALTAFVIVAASELLIWLPPLWRVRAIASWLWVIATVVSTIWLFVTSPTFLVALLLCIAGYRVVNLGRIIKGRVRDTYLKNVTWRTAWWLAALELIVLAAWWTLHQLAIDQAFFWQIVLFVQLAMAVTLLVTTIRHLHTTLPPADVPQIPTNKLPTVTVAVPARNETDELQICLESIVANDYPKLEVIVLDDCSPNPRTPEIIRGFAHDGVRFIAGEEADETWLAKNLAYERLAEESNGDIILFCGVDARFEPTSIRRLVETMVHKNKSMLSIMPRNLMPEHLRSLALLVQPMRYAWEFALPRKLFRRPPVLSTCWIIQRSLLVSAGGFRGVTRSIVPESYFARVAVVHDGYSFMQSDEQIGISCKKQITEQHDTATRTKYPQLHRRPELVFLLALFELLTLILPVVFVAASFAMPQLRLFGVVTAITSLLLVVWYILIVRLVYRKFLPASLIALPFAVIHDVAVLNYSMLKYEFSDVFWKGRNVCIPVMRVEPHLPAMDTKPL